MKSRIKLFHFICVACYFCWLNPHSDVFFSPDDHPTKRLIQIIDTTHKKIYAAVYMFTDKQIAEALVKAKKRGVDVKIIVDKASVEYEYGKAKLLKENGIDVYQFSDESKNETGKFVKFSALMHNKFAILDEQVWTGSFNWTKSANQKNQENVIITTNKKVKQRFEQHFEILKKRCLALGPAHKNKPEPSATKSIFDALKELLFQVNKSNKT